MPRGGKRSHKGQHRRFTGFEELAEQSKEIEKEKWREPKKDGSDDEKGAAAGKGSDSDSDESSSDEEAPRKGVAALIDIENPNRVQKKSSRKVTELENEPDTKEAKPELSRREREEIEKQRAKAHYEKMHKQGKTPEAQADLARLAIIRKKREDEAKRREEEKKAKEAKSRGASS